MNNKYRVQNRFHLVEERKQDYKDQIRGKDNRWGGRIQHNTQLNHNHLLLMGMQYMHNQDQVLDFSQLHRQRKEN